MRKAVWLIAVLALFVVFSAPSVIAQEGSIDTAKAAVEATQTETPESAPAVAEPATDTMPADTAQQEAPPPAAIEKEAPEGAGTGDAPGETTITGDAPGETTIGDEAPAQEEAVAEPEVVDPTAPYKSVTFAEGEKPRIIMETTMGRIVVELWPDVAPKHCQSIVYLTNKGYFDSLTFHRVVPGFVIQGGDPNGNGTGGPGYNVPAEFNATLHEDGILSMARSADPNSAGSQFFICLGRLASLDGNYTVFGKVVEGLDVVHKIEKTPATRERPNTPVIMTKVTVED
ncbi:MAG TPA: peptidylprolyl isomerase [Acidobacteriota bacterium]|nr:peptidylprolyl isomerase [Acidobacteriota bacterium]